MRLDRVAKGLRAHSKRFIITRALLSSMLKRIKKALGETNTAKAIKGEWRFKGVTNRFMPEISWTNGHETVSAYYMSGAGHHAGFVVEVDRGSDEPTLKLTNGFANNIHEALVLADMHMRDDIGGPAAFMHSDKITSDKGPGGSVRQDEWLGAHGREYEFAVVNPEEAKEAIRS